MLGHGIFSSPVFLHSFFAFFFLRHRTAGRCAFHFDSRDSKSGNFSSPNFPNNYPSAVRCEYSFRGRDFEGLKINFFVFDLEPPYRAGCLSDYLDVSSITLSNEKNLVGRFCGSQVPNPLITMSPDAHITFSTDHAVHHGGFQASYTFIHEKDVPPPVSTPSIEGCGGMVSGAGGFIVSPGYPASYPANVDCTWLLRAQYRNNIYVKVHQLQFLGSIADCGRSALYFYDGYGGSTDGDGYIRKLCGDLKYYTVEDRAALTSRNRLVIRFRTTEGASSPQRTVGFKLIWTQVALVEPRECDRFVCRGSEFCVNHKTGSAGCNKTKNFCIDKTLVCDGQLNCSDDDDSDESDCYFAYIVGGASGLLSVPLLALLAVIVYRRRRRRVRRSASQTQNLTLQLRQLDRSPSCSSRQCDVRSPTVPRFVNGGNCYFAPPTSV